jgi:LPS export ABC transporter protein LptC
MASWFPGVPGLVALRSLRAFAVFLLSLLTVGPGAARAEDLVLSRMTFVGSEAGERDIVLTAERARIAHGEDVAHLEGVELDAAGDHGTSSLVMSCDRAQLDLATSDFTAEGNVRGRTADGHRFTTQSARFQHAARVIESQARVDIVDPSGTRLEGQGFRYDVRAQRMRMRNAVVSELSGDVVSEPAEEPES